MTTNRLFSTDSDVCVTALVKGDERYIFIYDDEHRGETLQTIGRFAEDENLSLTWKDASVLANKIRKLEDEAPA